MNPEQLTAWISVGSVLIQAGIATVTQVRGLLLMLHGEAMEEAQLNAILTTIADDAARRKELADADQDQARRDAGSDA